MSFRSFSHNYHEGHLTHYVLGPSREITLEIDLSSWCNNSTSTAVVRLDAVENFEAVRAFLEGSGDRPELDCLQLLTEGPNWVFLALNDGRSVTIRSHHVSESS